MKPEIETFDGLDNRKDILRMLERLGSDHHRAMFIKNLMPMSVMGFSQSPVQLSGPCSPIAAYFLMVNVCNSMGVSINSAVKKLEREVRKL